MASSTPTFAEFQAHAAREISRVQQEHDAGGSNVAAYLRNAGIPADVTPGDNGVQVTVQPDENAGLPAGTKRTDFTSAALAAMDARALKAEKERVYQWLRKMGRGGHYTTGQLTSVLQNLGYTTVPTVQTEVTFTTDTVRRDRYGDWEHETVKFTVPGEVTQEQAMAQLEAAAQPSGAVALAKAAFPQAEKLPSGVRDVYVTATQSWPAYSEFRAENSK